MTCTNCSVAVERVLHGVEGVRKANVALALGEARVAYDPAFTDEVSAVCCALLPVGACRMYFADMFCWCMKTGLEPGWQDLTPSARLCHASDCQSCRGAASDGDERGLTG